MDRKNGSDDYVIRVIGSPAEVDAAAWDRLVEGQPSAGPFMRHAYLLALHESGSATDDTGWTPAFLTVTSEGELVAACPLYVKDHSYGEYVFDWAWADAYHRHGLKYYPKLLSAVPFTPVPGPRLLARDAQARIALLEGMTQFARQADLSSAHVLFLDEADQAAARTAGWLMRSTVQFHWTQREPEPYADFADFLAHLNRDKRKKIQQERRRVQESGVTFTTHEGEAIGTELWDFFYRCYGQTYAEHRSTPYLSRDFFARMQATMPAHWLMFVAWRDGRRVAASLIAIDPGRGNAFGRYWGAVEHIPNLHFEPAVTLGDAPGERLVVARFEVQVGNMFHRAPVPPEGVAPTGIDGDQRGRHPAAVAPGDEHQPVAGIVACMRAKKSRLRYGVERCSAYVWT